jgi:hypothetical protein
MVPSIEEIWIRLKSCEGEDFETKTGKAFRYEIRGNLFLPSRAKQQISKAEFGKVLDMVPLDGPGQISQLVRGSAYVWAVLHDRRIRREDW